MFLVHLLDNLLAHPHLAVTVVILVALVLHLPYRYERRRDRRGGEDCIWRSALYRYEDGPNHARLDYDGLRRLQRAILGLLSEAWAALRGDLLRRLVDELRRRLGM